MWSGKGNLQDDMYRILFVHILKTQSNSAYCLWMLKYSKKNTEMGRLPLRWKAGEQMETGFHCIYKILFSLRKHVPAWRSSEGKVSK